GDVVTHHLEIYRRRRAALLDDAGIEIRAQHVPRRAHAPGHPARDAAAATADFQAAPAGRDADALEHAVRGRVEQPREHVHARAGALVGVVEQVVGLGGHGQSSGSSAAGSGSQRTRTSAHSVTTTATSAMEWASLWVASTPGITLDNCVVASTANGASTRAPMLIAKLSPVTRRCNGNTRGR